MRNIFIAVLQNMAWRQLRKDREYSGFRRRARKGACKYGQGAVISLWAEIGEWAIAAEGSVAKLKQAIPPKVVVQCH